MRVNIYSQEVTDEVHIIERESNTGKTYKAIRFMLHSAKELHHTEDDDDRSAVTFWLPKSDARKLAFAHVMEKAAAFIMNDIKERSKNEKR